MAAGLRFTGCMLEAERAREIVDRIDLRALPICPACHLDLAFALVEGRSSRSVAPIVSATCTWVWLEIRVELLALVRRGAMRNQDWADCALTDLSERGDRSLIIREIVTRVAREMASDLRSRGLGTDSQPFVLTFPLPQPS